jgi:hypothetical protein
VELSGHEVREAPPGLGLCSVEAFEGERRVMKAVARADFIALRALVHGVLLVNRETLVGPLNTISQLAQPKL